MKKTFQLIHSMLLLAFVIGVPIAATTRGPHEDFNVRHALAQAGLAAAVLLTLLLLNMGLGRLWAWSQQRRRHP
ncbi:MAG: hypothetical protein RJA22_2483 [Verrucomicrobiota bacterium]|jgi:hypothetical protein